MRRGRSMLPVIAIFVLQVSCGGAGSRTETATSRPAATPLPSAPCPANYPDPQDYNASAYVGTGTVVEVIDADQFRARVDAEPGHPFRDQVLLLHLHGTVKSRLTDIGLRSGDRIAIDVWHFVPSDCSYVVVRMGKVAP